MQRGPESPLVAASSPYQAEAPSCTSTNSSPPSATARVSADGFAGPVKVLTSCPSCLQGLKRYDDDSATDADYIVVEMARHLLGEDWMAEYVRRANAGGIERVLV